MLRLVRSRQPGSAMHDFQTAVIETGEAGIFVRSAGAGPPVLLLHGFPETHLM